MWSQVEGEKTNKQKTVTLAAEKASTPQHSEKRRVCMSTVLARMEFTGEKSECRQTEKKKVSMFHQQRMAADEFGLH